MVDHRLTAALASTLVLLRAQVISHHIISLGNLIISNVKARPQESLRKHSTAGVESLGCLRAKDSPALWRHFLMWAPLSLPPFKLLLFSVISFRNCSPIQNWLSQYLIHIYVIITYLFQGCTCDGSLCNNPQNTSYIFSHATTTTTTTTTTSTTTTPLIPTTTKVILTSLHY